VRPPTEAERATLRTGREAEVVELRRVRLGDHVPVALETAVLSAPCIAPVMAADLETGSLHEVLIAAGIVPTRGTSTIGAEAADADDAVLLGVHAGEPVLVERRLIYDGRGRPIERTESRYAADRYGLHVGFSVEDNGTTSVGDRAPEGAG
jgi:GntR family transcriptional regulator